MGGGWERGAALRGALGISFCFLSAVGWAQSTTGIASAAAPEKIIIDTDIGDDVDDAFALALAVKSPELQDSGGDDNVWRYGDQSEADGPVFGGSGPAGDSGAGGEGYGDEESDVAAAVCGGRAFCEGVAWGCGGVSAGADSEVSGRDHAGCDWSADECGGGYR